MKDKTSKSSRFNDLRKKAEVILSKGEGKFTKDDMQDINHLLNELNIHQVELELQNDELRNTQNLLEEVNQKYIALFEMAPVGYFTMDRHGLIKEVNLTASALLGENRSYLINKAFHKYIHPDYRLRFHQHMKELTLNDMRHTVELKMVRKNGEEFFVQLDNLTNPYDHTNGVIRTSMTDITDRVKAEEELKTANEKLKQAVVEKELLMKEVNHRVKNHLALISSLIHLKMSVTGSKDLADLKNQIEAIIIVHDKMYQDNQILEMDFHRYTKDLLNTIINSLAEKPVKINVKMEQVFIPPKRITHLGLLINEIATNAIKHGFKDVDQPMFNVEMRTDQRNNEYTLVLSNNGKPLPENFNPDTADTLGLKLISALIEQIKGSLDIQKEPHPQFTISFPFPEK
jgi:PAS domain S-box-containing protein